MQHERGDNQQNPSEKTIALQKETAISMWAEMEDEEALVPYIAPSSSTIGPLGGRPSIPPSGPSTSRARNSKNLPKPDAKQVKPAVEAAKQRTKTMKDFKAVESGLSKALNFGENILGPVALKIHGDDQDSD